MPCWLHFYLGVYLTDPMMNLLFCGEFFLHIPCWLVFLNLGSFSYTSRAGVIFMGAVSLKHPVLASFLHGEFLLHIPCCLSFYVGSFFTHPVLSSFLLKEVLLHIACWLRVFHLGNLAYTSRAGLLFYY